MKSHRLPLIVVAAAALLTLSTANAGAREAPTQTEAQQAALVAPVYSEAQPASLPADVTGPQRVIMLRVYFNDYANTSRYSRADVEGLMAQVDTLYQNTSYGNVSIDYQVSELYQLPDNRSEYVDDGDGAGGTPCDPTSWGDLSCDDKYFKVLEDAIAASPDDLDWTNVDAVLVLMAETDPAQFHRGQGGCCWSLPMGPDGDLASVAATVVSENPDSSDRQVWGRWAHEIGHGLQQTELLDTGHPSNYNSEFELMDSNYPGQTGVFEKQAHLDFPGWLPEAKFQTFTPSCDVGPDPCTGLGGGMAFLWAMEYDPGGRPNDQAVKAYITDNLYYLVSVRRRVLGDELNGDLPQRNPRRGGLDRTRRRRRRPVGDTKKPKRRSGSGRSMACWGAV